MKDNANGAFRITYFSSCKDKNGIRKATNKCEGLHVGDVVSFEAEIVLVSCPLNPADWKHTFQIYPVGINESLTVDVEMLCDCNCADDEPGNSIVCHNHGHYKCGICECDKDYFGRSCECSK